MLFLIMLIILDLPRESVRISGATQLRYANPRPSLAAAAASVYVARRYSLAVYNSRKFAGGHLGES